MSGDRSVSGGGVVVQVSQPGLWFIPCTASYVWEAMTTAEKMRRNRERKREAMGKLIFLFLMTLCQMIFSCIDTYSKHFISCKQQCLL